MSAAKLVKRVEGQGMFGAGSSTPSFDRNLQLLEWHLPSGDQVRLETAAFQLDGRNPYAIAGGPVMPLHRVLEVKKKRMIGWKQVASAMEYAGAFELLNALIRTTRTYREAERQGQASSLLVRKATYEHARFGTQEYYTLTDDGVVAALTEAFTECQSVDGFLSRVAELERADPGLKAKKDELRDELERLRATVRR